MFDMNNDGNYQILHEGFTVMGSPFTLFSLQDFTVLDREDTRVYSYDIYKDKNEKVVLNFKAGFTYDEYDIFIYLNEGKLKKNLFHKTKNASLDNTFEYIIYWDWSLNNNDAYSNESIYYTEDGYNEAYDNYLKSLTLVTDEYKPFKVTFKDFKSVETLEEAIKPLLEQYQILNN